MFEFSYVINGKLQRIHANSVAEVKRLMPDALDIMKGQKINNAKLVEKQQKGTVIDPGRSSMV